MIPHINDCLSCGLYSELFTHITSSKRLLGRLHWELLLSPWKPVSSQGLPVINGPEFRFHLVPGLPGFCSHYPECHYPDCTHLSLYPDCLVLWLIKNVSSDRIPFGMCTSKESCTERSKQILVRSRCYRDDQPLTWLCN